MKKRAKFRWAITSAKAVANLFYDLFPEEDKKLNQPGKCWEKKEARWFRGASRHPSRLQQQHLFCSEICCEENHCVAKSCDKYWLWNVWKWKIRRVLCKAYRWKQPFPFMKDLHRFSHRSPAYLPFPHPQYTPTYTWDLHAVQNF